MISWLKGKIIQIWHLSSKSGVILDVGGVGYEVQLLSNHIEKINKTNETEFWIHQITREESINLYGFNESSQRDLFRKIISVNGIGPQIGMALLDAFGVNQIVDSIQDNDIKSLTKTQGIGKRIAERLVVELKNQLHEFNIDKEANNVMKNKNLLFYYDKYIEEIKSILYSLGYVDNEIKDSIEFIITKENTLLINSLSAEAKTELMDMHLKKILIRLSQKST